MNITTKRRTTEGFESRITTAGGSYYTQDYMVQHGGKTGQFDYYLTGRYRDSEDNRDDADFSVQNYSMRMGYDLDEHFRINFDNLTMSSRFTDPGPVTAPRKDNWYKVRVRAAHSLILKIILKKPPGL